MHMICFEIKYFRFIKKGIDEFWGKSFLFTLNNGAFLTDISICNFCNLDTGMSYATEVLFNHKIDMTGIPLQ